MTGPTPPPLALMGMEARLRPGLCPWGRGMERETDLPQTFVRTISVVPLVEGQLLLVLQRHSGDRSHASGEVRVVVQAQVGGGICGKIEASPGDQRRTRLRRGRVLGERPLGVLLGTAALRAFNMARLGPGIHLTTASCSPHSGREGRRDAMEALLSARHCSGLSPLLIPGVLPTPVRWT